jgi:hypothetical protein
MNRFRLLLRRLAMERMARLVVVILFLPVALGLVIAQTQPNQKKSATSQKAKSEPLELGKSYAALRPEQKRLVDDFVRRYNATTGSNLIPERAYDNARLSIRTTFDAVTHALLNAKITDAHGKSLGRAIDLVDAVDEVMGEESGVGGDRQFRLYVYLKPNAVGILSQNQEFFHDRDNSVYHKGFPTCYRLKKGPPSIQISVSRDNKLADIDVDYRSSSFPKALVNGHLSASNSDVRAGNNLDRHDGRWSGLNGWWRNVFGQLGTGTKSPKENATQGLGHIPLNPGVKADEGVDKSAHDFLQSWVVGKEPTKSVAYFSPRSYPCLEAMPQNLGQSVSQGMVRLRTLMAMQKFSDSAGTVNSVADVFEPADKGSHALKPAKNAYASEFWLVGVPTDMARDEECVAIPDKDSSKRPKEKYFATAFRGKKGDSRDKVMSLLWTEEGDYWKIIAIRIEDSSDAGLVPNNAAAQTEPSVEEPRNIAGDAAALKDITQFYQTWIVRRNVMEASHFASERSYQCLPAPSEEQGKLTPIARIQSGLEQPLARITLGANLSDMMSSMQSQNDLLRPIPQENSEAFAMMAVPDQKAGSFLCQTRHLPETTPDLKPADAKYGNFYLTASRLNYGEEQSPALLLLWTREETNWRIVAWAVELP